MTPMTAPLSRSPQFVLGRILLTAALLLSFAPWVSASDKDSSKFGKPAQVSQTGNWSIQVAYKGKKENFTIEPATLALHQNEEYAGLPVFDPNGVPWRKGQPLQGVNAQECSVEFALVPESVEIRLHPEDTELLALDADYQMDGVTGCVGRVHGGKLGPDTHVFITYKSYEMRIDSVYLNAEKKLCLAKGTSHPVNPVPPTLQEGEKRLVNIWLSGPMDRLDEDHIFPIYANDLLDTFPALEKPVLTVKECCPKAYQKLTRGETIHILAWGDSVTDGRYLPEEDHWQMQFLARLKEKFPKAEIILHTEAWGGRTTAAYKAEPAGSEKNYQEKVLNLKPDLIISEFVNDAYLDAAGVEKQYSEIRDEFQNIGAEWIILTPHYVRPNWMGMTRQNNVNDDPRPYTAAIREFAANNHIALADASLLYGRFWQIGIPYNTLMVNNINHPNAYGMSIFADALMRIF